MASGYLGKISAIVSANTAGYVRSLNEAAKETKGFAKTVQSDITRASNEAKRAFDSMYTPLQRVQRALQAASSQKLSFKGFDGGIKTISQLKRSLKNLQQATNISLKITGKESLTQLRQEIDSLGSDVQQALVANFEVGNIQEVKRLLNSVSTGKAIQTSFNVVGAENLEQLIERIDTLQPKDVQIVLDTVNQGALSKAVDELQKLQSVASQLAAPLGIAAKEFGKLGASVQAGFIPALSEVQNEVSAMERSIKQGTGASENRFLSLDGKVQKVIASMSRLSQASDITAGMRTGNELEFSDPNFQQKLLDARDASNASANIPASRRQSDGQIKEIVSNLNKATQESLRLQATLEKTRATGFLIDIMQAEDELEKSVQVVDQLTQKLQAKNSVEAEAAALAQKQAEAQKQRLANANSLLQVVDPNKDAAIGASQNIEAYLIQLKKIEEREQKIALNRAKMANASDFLQVVTANPDAVAGASTPLDPAFLQRNTEDKATRELGANISKASRDMDKLKSKTVSLRDTIETLPNSVASGLVPQLRRAEQEFVRLRASASASEEEIENASNEVDQLAASVRRIGASQGISTFAEAFDDAQIRGALGSLTALQQLLLRIGATAGDQAADAFEEMRVAVQRATIDGTLQTGEFNEELENLIHNAANAASSVGNIKAGAAFNEIKRGGDIARGGFDKMSMGLQQAAFALDDFFSATGGITQKIRAVQNNITQLGFVVGGTKGLFIALGVAIAAQATLALAKWVNGGVSAEDQTEALNEALEKQKQIVEALKSAFDSLRDATQDGIFTDAQQSSQSFREEIKKLQKAQDESRTSRASRFDSDVQQNLGQQKVLEKRLEGATSGGQRVAIERELDALRKKEVQLRKDAVNRPSPSTDDVVAVARQTVRANEFLEGGRSTQESQRRARERADALETEIRGASGAQEIADALDRRIAERQKVAQQDVGFLDFFETGPSSAPEIFRAREDVANLQQQRDQLEIPLTAERDALIVSALEFSQGVSSSLVEAKGIVENSLESFDSVAVDRKRLAEQFANITDQLTDPDADLSQDQVTQLRQQQESLKKQIDANLSAARSAETFAETLNRVASDLADTLLSEATSGSEQARRDLNEAEGRRQALPVDATDAQRRKADRDVEVATRNKREAEEDRKRTRDERQSIREDRRKEQDAFNRDARAGRLSPDAQNAIKERENADKEVQKREKERARVAAIPEFIRDPGALEREDRRLAAAKRKRQETRERTEGTLQDEFEARPGVQRLEKRSDDLDVENARREEVRKQRKADESASIERGRQLTMSDRQKRDEELQQQTKDIENALLADRELGKGDAELLQGLNNARGSFFQGTMMAGFQQERRNALLQGPSRAALQATDVTTTQGQSELNRLIRGDDSALDVNLVELQKQSEELARINEKLDQVGNNLGII